MNTSQERQPSPRTIFVISWFLLAVVSVIGGTIKRDDAWSKPMGIRINVGFNGNLSSPLVASQLASGPAELAEVFGRHLDPAASGVLLNSDPLPLVEASNRDAKVLCKLLKLDFVYMACYLPLMLGCATILRRRGGFPCGRLTWVVYIAIGLTVVADLLENYHSLKALTAIRDGTALEANVISMMRVASLTKWGIFSLVILVIAWGTARLKTLSASFASLVLVGGGISLIWGLVDNHRHASLIEVGFVASSVAGVLLLAVVLGNKDAVLPAAAPSPHDPLEPAAL